ncbi:MAG: hypothetical protein LBP34_06115 [Flavobacteriaceae bacterium]|jgi:hypothetical protein|nr:hypothetical protein [Flavobacteriaceae bacterium]
MNRIWFLFLFFTSFGGNGQNIALQDSIRIDIPASYTFFRADIFNSLYFFSNEENSLLKYNPNTKETYFLKDFTPSKKLFIVNPLFLVVLNKINKTLAFYDDKLIATQDKIPILTSQIINPDLIFIEDNNSLTYFDEFATGRFIQYDYRVHKDIIFSNSLYDEISVNKSFKEIYLYKNFKFLLLQRTGPNDSIKNNYTIIKQNIQNAITYNISNVDFHYWNDKNFLWITDDHLYSYDFENEAKKIKLPQKGEGYYIFNQQLFLWKPKVMYLYKLETEN